MMSPLHPTKPNDCPDCRGGEHHPTHDVLTVDNKYCTCPCAKIMTRQEASASNGERLMITGGRWVGRILRVEEWLPGSNVYAGTTIDHRSKVRHIVVNEEHTEKMK